MNIRSSSFSKFFGQSPIFIDSNFEVSTKKYRNHFSPKFSFKQREDSSDIYTFEIFFEPVFFDVDLNISVILDRCTFLDCHNPTKQGGAISFRKDFASLIIESCIFLRCTSFRSAGAIYVIQMYNGFWLEGDVNITSSSFEECYDNDQTSGYVAGVIDAYVAKGRYNYAFLMNNTVLVNCQFDEKNKITEAQIRLNSNIIYFNYNNVTNNNHKIDASAILFVKYLQEKSSISFLNAFNQYGFSFFEIYDLESGYINIYNINMVNTTFTNFDQGSVLIKIAFFNVYFAFENCFYLDNFYAIDFTTICTDDGEIDYDIVEPVIIQIPELCAFPSTYNIYSNKPFSISNQIEYKIIPEMRYDYDLDIFTNMPKINETPTPTPLSTLIPIEATLNALETNFLKNDLLDSIQSNKKSNMKVEIIVGIVVGVVIIVASIIIFINVILQKKNSNIFSKHINHDGNEDNSYSEDSDAHDNKNDIFNQNESSENPNGNLNEKSIYELFYNPKNKTDPNDPIKVQSLIHSLVNDDPFKNDIEEYTHLSD